MALARNDVHEGGRTGELGSVVRFHDFLRAGGSKIYVVPESTWGGSYSFINSLLSLINPGILVTVNV